jgi:dsDNA-specific endonuclease/ATPase MutS2
MDFKIGDKVLFKNEKLKGEVIKINSNYKLTVLSSDGFELNVAVKDLVKIEKGTDKAISYGENIYTKDIDSRSSKSQKKLKSQTVLKIDLHIELLTSNYHYLDNFEIVQLQLNECHKKIQQAINSNISKLIIVHGIGTGVLKSEVHKLLRNYKLRFYLSKDAGATEVMV